MIGFCPLASGSKGNCLYLGTAQTKILIDAGLSAKAIVARLQLLSVDITEIEAIVITHDHADHILGLKVLAFKYGIPVFANYETAKGITDYLSDSPRFKIFSTGETFYFADLEIHPFSIQHDTMDPVAFTVNTCGLKLGICADLGVVTTTVRHHLQRCDYLYLEANHQPEMVWACPRPMVYKQRVLGRNGHLSNEACGQLLKEIWHPDLRHVYLAHLSSECNSPEKALTVVNGILGEKAGAIPITIAPQETAGVPSYFELPAAIDLSTAQLSREEGASLQTV